MRKATVKRWLVRQYWFDPGEHINARQEISRGNGAYGVGWKFFEISPEEFKAELLKNKKDWVYCIETLSGKYQEVTRKDIGKYTNL